MCTPPYSQILQTQHFPNQGGHTPVFCVQKFHPWHWPLPYTGRQWRQSKSNCSNPCTCRNEQQHVLLVPLLILASDHWQRMVLMAASWANRASRSRASFLQVFLAQYCENDCITAHQTELMKPVFKKPFPWQHGSGFPILRCFTLSRTTHFW